MSHQSQFFVVRPSVFDLIRAGEDDLSILLQAICQDFEANRASLFLLEPDNVFKLKAQIGFEFQQINEAFIKVGEGIAGEAILSGVPRIVNGHRASRFSSSPDIHSALVIPLFQSAKVIGVLNLSRIVGESEFDSDILEKAAALSAALGFIVANAALVRRLQAEKHKTEQTLDALGVSFVIFSSSGVVVGSNQAFTEIFGEAFGHRGEFELHLRKTGKVELVLLNNHPDVHDQRITMNGRELYAKRIDFADGEWGVAFEDVTQTVMQEKSVHKLSRLAEMGRMTAAIAHDLRNPLTGIKSAAQLLSGIPGLPGELGNIIESEADRLNRLCNEFLESAGPHYLTKTSFEQGPIWDRIVRGISPLASRQGVVIQVVSDADTTISADDIKLEQVGYNLAKNAIEACQPGGHVLISLRRGGFSVLDSGSGIPPEVLSELGQPFVTTKASGTGLGISNVKRIVEAHGGIINFQSSPEGTEVTVSVPEEA